MAYPAIQKLAANAPYLVRRPASAKTPPMCLYGPSTDLSGREQARKAFLPREILFAQQLEQERLVRISRRRGALQPGHGPQHTYTFRPQKQLACVQASEAVRGPALACCCPSPRKDVLGPRPLPDTSCLKFAVCLLGSCVAAVLDRTPQHQQRQATVVGVLVIFSICGSLCELRALRHQPRAQPGTHQVESR